MKTNHIQPTNGVPEAAGTRTWHPRAERAFGGALGLLFAFAWCLMAGSTAQASITNYWIGGTDLNWSTAANWLNGALPAETNEVCLGSTGANAGSPPLGAANNAVDTSMTIQSLFCTNDTGYHITVINPGVTLAITNGTVVPNTAFGSIATALFAGTGADEGVKTPYYTIQGPGAALLITAPNAIVNSRQGSATYGSRATLDMSLLDTFTAQISRMLAGGDGYTVANNRAAGNIWLAYTNYIDCTSSSTWGLTIGDAPGGNGAPGSTVYLGTTNTILSDYGMLVSGRRNSGTLKYNAYNTYGPGSGSLFRNRAGTGRQSHWQIADQGMATGYTSGGSSGTVDFSLAPVDAMVDQLIVGRAQPFANSTVWAAGSWGILSFANGTINANSAIVGYRPTVNGCPAGGQVYVNGTAQLTINNNLTLGVAGPTTNTTINSTGAVFVNGGSMTVGGNIIDGFGPTNIISVYNGGNLTLKGLCGSPKTASQGPLANLSLNNCTLTIDRGVLPSPTTAICTVSNLTTGPTVNLNVMGAGLFLGQFPLISYTNWTGSFSDFATTVAPPIQGYVSNNVANNSIDLVITNLTADFWNGQTNGVDVGFWDIATTPDWVLVDGTTPTTYNEASVPGDVVIFDDSAHGTTTVTLTTTISPSMIDANPVSKNYTLTGSGALSGPGGLYKTGAGTLTVANSGSNGFTGPVTVNEGTLQLGGSADRLPSSAAVTLGPGAVLDLNNQNQTLSTVSGSGSVTLGSGTLSFTAGGAFDGVISGSGGLVTTNSGTLTLSSANQYSGGTLIISNAVLSVINASGSGLGSGNIDIEGGILYVGSTAHGSGGAYGDVSAAAITNNLAISTNLFSSYLYVNRSDDYVLNAVLYGSGQMYLGDGPGRVILNHANFQTGQTTSAYGPVRIGHPNALGTGFMLVGGVAGAALELVNNITVTNPLSLVCKGGALHQPPDIINVSGTNTLSGPITLLTGGSDWVFRSDGGKLVVSGPISNPLGATRNYWLRGNADGDVYSGIPLGVYVSPYQPTNNLTKDGTGTWVLWGTNTYNGVTTVSNGTLLVNGYITPAAVSGSTNVLVYGGMLGGNGLLTTPVVIYNASFSPGAYSNTIGTLTLSNNLTFNSGSTCVMDLSANGGVVANDQVIGIKTVTYNGILQVNLSGALQGGEIFKLFGATTYGAANFSSFNLPAIPTGLSWDTSQLTVDGTLRVAGGDIQFGQLSLAGDGNFQMIGTSASTNYAYRVLATTNLTDASSWIPVGSGTFTGGAFSFVDLDSTNYPHRFYRVVMP